MAHAEQRRGRGPGSFDRSGNGNCLSRTEAQGHGEFARVAAVVVKRAITARWGAAGARGRGEQQLHFFGTAVLCERQPATPRCSPAVADAVAVAIAVAVELLFPKNSMHLCTEPPASAHAVPPAAPRAAVHATNRTDQQRARESLRLRASQAVAYPETKEEARVSAPPLLCVSKAVRQGLRAGICATIAAVAVRRLSSAERSR